MAEVYDVVIVGGGGAAGLSGAIVFGSMPSPRFSV